MKIHLPGLFHTKTTSKFSHCAFTGKVLRFSKMVQPFGWDVVEYSNGVSESAAKTKVQIYSDAELKEFRKETKKTNFVGDLAQMGSPLHVGFSQRLSAEMRKHVSSGDIIAHPFGSCHQHLASEFPDCYHVETGIGYPDTWSAYRIYESYAWMHCDRGKSTGRNYDFVIGNYFDLEDWDINLKPKNYYVYLGRICDIKGLNELVEIAQHVDYPIVICGQGDPTPYLKPNIIYKEPICGRERSKLLGGARACLMPSQFIEPFAGAGVEAMLCGTPLVSVDFGAFAETIIHGVTGYRCHTLGDWIQALQLVESLSRETTAAIARSRYSLEACGKKYDQVFQMIRDQKDKGWYTEESRTLA